MMVAALQHCSHALHARELLLERGAAEGHDHHVILLQILDLDHVAVGVQVQLDLVCIARRRLLELPRSSRDELLVLGEPVDPRRDAARRAIDAQLEALS